MKASILTRKNVIMSITVLGILVAVVTLVVLNNRITDLSNQVKSQNSNISSLGERVKKYTYNPQSLNECLNDAAYEYTNYVSTHGTPVPNEKGVGYSMDSDQWQVAESNFKKQQSECNIEFNNK